ncbi:MAG: hypothetical protein AB9M53_00580 [Leptothrix sp. (in: b-proteobacteria)]
MTALAPTTVATEAIDWQPISRMPDCDLTLLVSLRDDTEPVWLGYFDGEDWRNATDGGLFAGHVIAWADMPRDSAC